MSNAASLLLLAVAGLFTFTCVAIARYSYERSLVSPIVIVPLASFLYLASNIVRVIDEGSVLTDQEVRIFFIGLLAVASFLLGAGLSRRAPLGPIPASDNALKTTGYVLFVLGLLGQLYILKTQGVLFFVEGKGERNLAYGTLGVEKFSKDLLIPAQVLLTIHYTRIRAHRSKYFVMACALIFLVFLLYEVRSAMAIQILTFLYFYDRNVRRLQVRQLLPALAFLVILGLMGKEFFYFARQWMIGEPAAISVVANPLTAFLTQHEFYAWVEILKNVEHKFLHGETLGKSLASTFFPAFLGGQSYSPTQWYADVYEPAVAQLGFGRGFSFVVELYINFGWLGMVLVLVAVGLLIRKADDSRQHDFIAAFAAGAFPFLWTGNTAILFKTYLILYLILPFLMVRAVKLTREVVSLGLAH